ncbi:MAG: PAS domain-containing protein [Chloroflexales bacterium]|nr:PAS domain-containing protein [Chloroflexales bacterium]
MCWRSRRAAADDQVRAALQRSEASLRLLAAQLSAIVWTTDAALRVTSVVGATQLQPGRPPEWYLGKTLHAILGAEAAALPIIPAHQRALKGEAAQYEHRAAGRIFAARVQPLRDQQQGVLGCLGLALDNTERTPAEAACQAAEQRLVARRLEAERLAERERARHELFSSVSHDLRTPLTAARAALGLLETTSEGLGPGDHPLLDNARRNLERLRLLVDDLIAANQLLVGAAPLASAPVPLDLRTVVEAAIAPLAALIARRGQTLVRELPMALPVRGDPAQLEQAVSNLLANAHYHTGPGTRIDLAGWQAPGTVRLAIRDDGPGITPELAATLFQPLQRLGEEAVGSGLGLAVARAIVERHGGRLWYEPAPGRGVTFSLALPSISDVRSEPGPSSEHS